MIRVNGKEVETVGVQDRGLHYGDGVFETIAVVDGRPRGWSRHLHRLLSGISRLRLPPLDVATLELEVEELLRKAAAPASRMAVLKMIYTAGSGGHGYRRPQAPEPLRVLLLRPWPYSESQQQRAQRHGVQLHLCQTRLGEQPLLAGIKHLNRLEQVVARGEWDDPEVVEGVLLNHRQELVEGTMSNLFLLQDGAWVTPPLRQAGVAGTTRERLLQRLQQRGEPVVERSVPVTELENVEEMICTNALIGVWPVARLGPYHFTAPGPYTRKLLAHFPSHHPEDEGDESLQQDGSS